MIAPRALRLPGLIYKPLAVDHLVLCSRTGRVAPTLLASSQMFEAERVLEDVAAEARWTVDDYFVLAKLLEDSPALMGVIPEPILAHFPKLRKIRRLPREGKISAFSWPGSVGVRLLKRAGSGSRELRFF